MSKAKEILSGYAGLLKSKVGLSSEQENEIAEARLDICSKCPYGTGRSTCKRCGCVLKAKARCMECKCPEKKWNEN